MAKPSEKIRLALVDDHLTSLESYKNYVKFYPDLEVVGLALSAKELLQHLSEWKPQVVLVDLKLGAEESGVGLIQELVRRDPSVKALMLTGYGETDQQVLEGLRVGAYGYLSKGGEPEESIVAIRQAYQHRPVLTNAQLEVLLKHYRASSGSGQEAALNPSNLECSQCWLRSRAKGLNFKHRG